MIILPQSVFSWLEKYWGSLPPLSDFFQGWRGIEAFRHPYNQTPWRRPWFSSLLKYSYSVDFYPHQLME